MWGNTWSTGSQISRSPSFCPFLTSLTVNPPSMLIFLCCSKKTRRAPFSGIMTNRFHWRADALRPHYLEYDLALQLRGWRQLLGQVLHGFDQQFVSKYFSESTSHLTLLIYRAVLLYGQNHREPETTRRGYRDVLNGPMKKQNPSQWIKRLTKRS